MNYATRSASCHPIRCLANSYSQQNARDYLKGLQRYKRGKSVDRIPGERRLPGSARVSRVGETAPVSRTVKDCFGETSKPARETRALPGSLRLPEQLECTGPI
jgi:hypothetical protein